MRNIRCLQPFWLVINVLQTYKKCAWIANHRKITTQYNDPFTCSIFSPWSLHKYYISSLYNVTYSLMDILANNSVWNIVGTHWFLDLWIPQPFVVETRVCKTKNAHCPLALQRPCFKLHRPMPSIKSIHQT